MRDLVWLLMLLLIACPSSGDDSLDFDGDGVNDEDDCAASDPDVYPGATEIIGDGTDQDCDGLDDIDGDGDGSYSLDDCDDADDLLDALDRDGDSFSLCDGDCDDGDADVNPDAEEVPGDGTDQDCDGFDDIDADGDGAFSLNDCDDTDPELNLDDNDGDGASNCAGDCDDDDPALNPNDADADDQSTCAGDCDDDDPARTTLDVDGDGASSCAAEPDCDDDDPVLNLQDLDQDGWTSCGGDCVDTDSSRHPEAAELCNAVDDDCDGLLSDAELDLDGDGDTGCEDCDDTDPAVTGTDEDLDGFTPCTGDCSEANATINPFATDNYGDGLDQNCDGQDGTDGDGDGFSVDASADPDCDDTNPAIHPGAAEVCDGIDTDCVDDPDELDGDGDGDPPCGGDCDDGDAELNTLDADGDGLDSCSGDCDDSDPAMNLSDGDGDGVAGCDGDCDDADPAINPSAAEVCDGLDNDCDGTLGAPDTFEQPEGPDLAVSMDWLLCGIFQVDVGAQISSFEMQVQPSFDSSATFALFEGPGPSGPWTRQWVSPQQGFLSTAMQWVESGSIDRTLPAGEYAALCMTVSSDASYMGNYSETGQPTETSFGSYVSAIDWTEISSMPVAMPEDGWPSWMPIRVHTITSEDDADGDGESACTDCNDADADTSNSDGDGDGLTGCDGDCDDTDAGIPNAAWDTPWDGVDTDCDGTDHTNLDEASARTSGSDEGRFGQRAMTVGDVDGDGVDDVWVSEPDADGVATDTGSLYLLSGADLLAGTADLASPLVRIDGSQVDDALGEDFTVLPDLDGDGFGELAVWSPESPYLLSRKGEVLIFASESGTWGGPVATPADADLRILPHSTSEFFSAGLIADGDLDGDSIFDLVIPTDNWSSGFDLEEGAALVFTGAQLAAALGGADLMADDAWLILAGEHDDGHMGMWVGYSPDLDGDGRDELWVGSAYGPRSWTGHEWLWPTNGQTHLILSGDVSSGGVCTVALTGCSTAMITGDVYGDRWFRAVPTGDLDGDLLSDFAVGSLYVDGAGNLRGGLGVYTAQSLLVGGTFGISDAEGWFEGSEDLSLMSGLHSSLGDLDGDGLNELLSSMTDVADGGFSRPGALIMTGAALAASLTGPPGDETATTDVFAAVDLDAGLSAGGPLGDLDGDGKPEIWLGAPYRDLGGSSDGTLHVLEYP